MLVTLRGTCGHIINAMYAKRDVVPILQQFSDVYVRHILDGQHCARSRGTACGRFLYFLNRLISDNLSRLPD